MKDKEGKKGTTIVQEYTVEVVFANDKTLQELLKDMIAHANKTNV